MIRMTHRSGLVLAPFSTKSVRSYTSQSRWTQPQRLREESVEPFFKTPKRASVLNSPVLLPEAYFHTLPAIHKWFTQSRNQDSRGALLDQLYLLPFQNALVPLEFTQLSSKPADTLFFHRAEAPFGIFLSWATHAKCGTMERLYLAQASVSALPQELRNDVPPPDLITQAGNGDIHDTNIWMGAAPTYTPLHRDPNPNLLVQLAGQKMVRLLAPEVGGKVFAAVQESVGRTASATFRGEEMMKGEEKALLEACIWDDSSQHFNINAAGFEIRLGLGDGLYIPQGWWHSVKGIGSGMVASVNWWFR